jgi:hexosaminidase
MPRRCLPLICCLLTTVVSAQSASRELDLMPLPASYQMEQGQLAIDQAFTVGLTGYREPRLSRAVQRALHTLSRQTGVGFPQDCLKACVGLGIYTAHASKPVQELGEDESYSLEITASGATLNAQTPLGTLHGLQTFLHLVHATPTGYAVPFVSIQDKPRFPWRGLMVDVSRHFMPLDSLRRTLDGMEAVQLNVFHWHLSDNQGFRVESKKFPKLQGEGSDGNFYTQAEIRGLIDYARDRGIRVIPEFDVPGHCTAIFAAYPELASGPGPYQITREWGVMDPAMNITQEHTYTFLDGLFGEMAVLFPDQYFHIGGDEVNGKQWDANPAIQKFKQSHKIKDNAGLQAYFNQRLLKIVTAHGKTMMGWDEILAPELPKSIVIQSWRGQQSLADAARQGYRGLLSNGYYIDLMQPASEHYAADPLSGPAATLTPEEKQRVLGGEATMWTEYVSPENLDSRVWPRTAAIAERLWSPQETTDVNSMYRRLKVIGTQLDLLGLTHNSHYIQELERLAGSTDIETLKLLADVVEPVKGYTREETAAYPATSLTPLNRLVDAVPPESAAARTFSAQVDSLLSSPTKDPATMQQLRIIFTRWRDNDAKLQPLLQSSFLLKEDTSLSTTLAQLGSMGLQALDYIEHGGSPTAEWKSTQVAVLNNAKKPNSQLLLVVAPAVQHLVEGQTVPGTH